MKKYVLFPMLVILLSLVVAAPVFAQSGPPVGTCPSGYVLHPFHVHAGDHHHHIGLAQDLNQNNLICVLHLSSGFHVHMDDVLR